MARELFLMPCHALNRLTFSLEDYPNFAVKKECMHRRGGNFCNAMAKDLSAAL